MRGQCLASEPVSHAFTEEEREGMGKGVRGS
jgi:hypothetical protein